MTEEATCANLWPASHKCVIVYVYVCICIYACIMLFSHDQLNHTNWMTIWYDNVVGRYLWKEQINVMEKREAKIRGHFSRALDTKLITVPYLVCIFSWKSCLHLKMAKLNFCCQYNRSLGGYDESVGRHAESRKNSRLKFPPYVRETRFS